nr:hypothetical protein [Candidatus Woesearchaeota archaeon]
MNYNKKMELRKFLMNERIKKDDELSTRAEEIINTIRNHLDPVLSMPQDYSERMKYEPRVDEIETALRNQDYGSFRSSAYFFMNSLTL